MRDTFHMALVISPMVDIKTKYKKLVSAALKSILVIPARNMESHYTHKYIALVVSATEKHQMDHFSVKFKNSESQNRMHAVENIHGFLVFCRFVFSCQKTAILWLLLH